MVIILSNKIFPTIVSVRPELVNRLRQNTKRHANGVSFHGAAGQIRTADLILTKDALCLLSYSSKMATRKGLEPSTSGVTGRRSNQLSYRAILLSKRLVPSIHLAGAEGFEPSARGFGDRCSTS